MNENITEVTQLLQTLKVSTSPFHAVEEAARQLAEAGYSELELGASWDVTAGKGYYIKAYASTLIAFRINDECKTEDSFRIASAHTDWPCMHLKPSPEVTSGKYAKVNVEVYGGPILNTWLDRPLSLSGRVSLKGKSAWEPEIRLVDFDRPLLSIPNVAIHMNREVNNGIAYNPQVDMLPLAGIVSDTFNKENFFLNTLAKELKVEPEAILDYEFYVYDREDGELFGFQNEFISAPRLDNITSVQACVTGLIESSRKDGVDIIALFDNEEVGSRTKQGAASSLLEHVIEKLCLCLNRNRQQFLDTLLGSCMLSIDVAHAIHPNHPEKCDIKNQIYLNDGFAIKIASSQAYATDSTIIGVIESICQENKIPYKKFSNRSDIKGGGTLGSIASAGLCMKTVDVGVPMLAMHSARETMGVYDQVALVNLVRAYFN